MHFGALGDIHGAFVEARSVVARHPEAPFWVCVGDIASDAGEYEPLGARVYWVHGNNDNFDAIAAGALPPELHYIPNGTLVDAGSEDQASRTADAGDSRESVGRVFRPGVVRIAGLGGTFAPTWYQTPKANLPHPKKGSARASELADKRRHFVREQVDACKALRDVDLLLTHEAPKPFRPFPGRGPDAGKAQINEVIAAMRPRLHLFGHHHRFSEQIVSGVPSVGLDLVSRSYLLIDLETLAYEHVSSA